MKIHSFIISILILFSVSLRAADPEIPSDIEKTTRTFVTRDGDDLKLDIYKLKSERNTVQPCMMFVFGGGFHTGQRDHAHYNTYFTSLVQNGICVVSIDYRLGLKGAPKVSPLKTKPLENAIRIAVDDLFAATRYMLDHADEFKIDKNVIMASGSSAGAITVLQADYTKRNHFEGAEILPADFQYAGILAYAGAIFSRKGIPDYAVEPAPTLFFHGTTDKLVAYNKMRLFGKGFSGSKSLAKKFKKEGYEYCFYSMEGMSHSMATTPMIRYSAQILAFIRDFVFDKQDWQIDINFKDNGLEPDKVSTTKDLYI